MTTPQQSSIHRSPQVFDVTLTVPTVALAAGDVAAATQEIADFFPSAITPAFITGVILTDADDQGGQLDILLMNAATDIGVEDAANAISDAEALTILGWLDVNTARLASDRSSGINLYWDGVGNIKLDEFTATITYSNLMSVVKAWATGDHVMLDLSGTAYRCYHITAAGVITLLGSGTCTVTGALGTDVGVFSTDSGNTWDNFLAEAKGNEAQYENDLNRFIT